MRHSPAFDIVVVAQVDNNGDLTLMTLPNELLDHQQILAFSINFSDCGSIAAYPDITE
jgi:hypothetical protein